LGGRWGPPLRIGGLVTPRNMQWLNCEKKWHAVAERWKRGAKGAETNAEGVRIECPLPNRLGVWGSVVSSPSGVRGGALPKTNLVHFVAARRTLIATICLISVSLNTAVA